MTYITAGNLTHEKHQVFLEWLQAEGINPAEVVDNGRFSVYNGQVSGFKFLLTPEGKVRINGWDKPVLVPFRQAQKNPLPEVLA